MLRLPARSFHGSWRSAPARELEKGSHFAAAMSWRRKIGTAVVSQYRRPPSILALLLLNASYASARRGAARVDAILA
jgi:hypothetical protein